MDLRGREQTELVMSLGGEFAAIIMLVGLGLYMLIRIKGYKPNIILFFVIYLFPTSVLYIDVGFHLFYHRILLILYFVWFVVKKLFRLEDLKYLLNATTVSGFYFLLMCLPGLLFCIDSGAFWRWWLAILVGILLYLIILDNINGKKDLESIVFSCIVSGFVWGGVGLVLFVLGNPTLEADDIKQIYRVSALSKDANFFASILIAWIQLAFFWFIKKDAPNRFFVFIALITMIVSFIFTYSRGGYIALSVIALLNFLYFSVFRHKFSSIVDFKKVNLIIVMLCVMLLVAFTVIGSLRDRVISIKTHEKLGAGRGYIWLDALSVIKNNPLGVGLSNYIVYTLQNSYKYKTAGSSVHNVFLHLTAETGIQGLLSYLIFLGSIFTKIRYVGMIKDKELFHWYVGAITAFTGILFCSIFISNIYRENVFIAVAIFLSIYKLHRKKIQEHDI